MTRRLLTARVILIASSLAAPLIGTRRRSKLKSMTLRVTEARTTLPSKPTPGASSFRAPPT